MKSFKVIFQHGHFIDKETKRRIIPVQGAQFIITADPAAFTADDAKLKNEEPLSSAEKAQWAKVKFGSTGYGRMLKAGEQLFFRVGNSKRVQGDESRQYIFLCTILEDLYLYLLKGKEGREPQDWRLADCKCVLEECLLGGLTLTEKLPADSLNKLFSQTVMFYFSMQRSGATNAFNTFFRYKPGMKITFDDATNRRYGGLGNERDAFVASRGREAPTPKKENKPASRP